MIVLKVNVRSCPRLKTHDTCREFTKYYQESVFDACGKIHFDLLTRGDLELLQNEISKSNFMLDVFSSLKFKKGIKFDSVSCCDRQD